MNTNTVKGHGNIMLLGQQQNKEIDELKLWKIKTKIPPRTLNMSREKRWVKRERKKWNLKQANKEWK